MLGNLAGLTNIVLATYLLISLDYTKGQLISEATFLGFKSPKKQTKFLEGFVPLPLKWVKWIKSKNKTTLLYIKHPLISIHLTHFRG